MSAVPLLQRSSTYLKIPFGSVLVSYSDTSGSRVLRAAFAEPGDSNFSLSTTELFIGGMPISLYYSSSLNLYAIASVDSSSVASTAETTIAGIPLVTEITNTNFRIPKLETANDKVPTKETVFKGIPLAVNASDEIVFVTHTPSGSVLEEFEAFVGGVPLLIHRYVDGLFLVTSSSGGGGGGGSPPADCFASCQVDPPQGVAVTVDSASAFCTSYEGTWAAGTHSDAGTYKLWTWTFVDSFTAANNVLEIRCDEATGEVAAATTNDNTDFTWGGSDSIWAGFKVVTGDVTCNSGNNQLEGTIVLTDRSSSGCDFGGAKDMTIVL